MAPAWQMIDDILAGAEAIRTAGPRYLPKYESESADEYARRLKCAPWSGEFEDVHRTLTAKPFARSVGLADGASARMVAFAENVDARGSNLTTFARAVFEAGVAKGCHAIVVDYSAKRPARNLAEERLRGDRPYWCSVRAEDILALDVDFVGGLEVVVHLRVSECTTVREDYAEREVERVREWNRAPIYGADGAVAGYGSPTWRLWEATASENGRKVWLEVGGGTLSLPVIPIVLFWTGKREGAQYVRPPLLSIADKQMELYRAQAREDEVLTYAGSPMLAATGLTPPKASDAVQVGPKRILYAPADGGWSYIQPDPDALRQIREHVAALVEDIRRLGMQPLLRRSGDVSATASAIEGARAHSAVQSWALALRDALTAALAITSQWFAEEPTAKAVVHVDFAAGVADQVSLDSLNKARAARDISHVAYVEGLKRFGVLASDFDVAADEELIAMELEPLTGEPPELHLLSGGRA